MPTNKTRKLESQKPLKGGADSTGLRSIVGYHLGDDVNPSTVPSTIVQLRFQMGRGNPYGDPSVPESGAVPAQSRAVPDPFASLNAWLLAPAFVASLWIGPMLNGFGICTGLFLFVSIYGLLFVTKTAIQMVIRAFSSAGLQPNRPPRNRS